MRKLRVKQLKSPEKRKRGPETGRSAAVGLELAYAPPVKH